MADINSGLVTITFLQHQHLIRTTFTLRPSGVVYSVPCTSYLWHPSWLHVYMLTLLAPYAFFLSIRFTIFFPASSSILSYTAKDFHIAGATLATLETEVARCFQRKIAETTLSSPSLI